jgi:ribosomal protein S18 acetylase RimI-like enzyme
MRDAVKDEFEFIREQRVDAYHQYAEVLPAGHWQALQQAISSEADTQSGVELIVAEVDGGIAGSVALFPANTDAYEGYLDKQDYPEIRMLAVSPQQRGKGIASALVSECIRRAQAKGFPSIGLHTGEFMKPAMKLYEKMGFERVPEHDFRPADDGITVKAYRLHLPEYGAG